MMPPVMEDGPVGTVRGPVFLAEAEPAGLLERRVEANQEAARAVWDERARLRRKRDRLQRRIDRLDEQWARLKKEFEALKGEILGGGL
jgi:predicted nuclease with TOPRIM domain